MRALRWLVLVGLVPILTSCGSSDDQSAKPKVGTPSPTKSKTPPTQAAKGPTPRELIIGTWELDSDDVKKTKEFHKNGTYVEGPKTKGRYRFLTEKEVEIELPPIDPLFPPEKQKINVRIDQDEMLVTDEFGNINTYKRSK
ncbi:MAG: hypothetical protein ACK4RK_18725 [Gemmataceae bacterium]